jgi:hypothetical protein
MTFVIRNASNLRLRVEINTTEVFDENIVSSNLERSIQELFSMRDVALSASGTQVARFTAVRGRGTVSDVVVWYRRDSE